MSWEGWYTLAVVGAMFVGLLLQIAAPDMLLLAGLIAVTIVGIITPEQAVAGFSNNGMLTVGALFVVAAALRETGALDAVGRRMLGRARSERSALARFLPQVGVMSAFLNNTAVVAMLLPVASDWCRKNNVAPSKLLLPLSYATILGGTCTLIGTSTNLVVSGLMESPLATHEHAMAPLGLFELAWVGVPCAVIGMLFITLIGRFLLPDRRELLETLSAASRRYLANLRVARDCPFLGKSIKSAGLRRLPGLHLIEVQRRGRVISPVPPDERLEADDFLTFTGAVSTIVDLERIRGFIVVPDADAQQLPDTPERHYTEAVVSPTSPLVGQTIRDSNFRARYNAAVVAVHRGAKHLEGRIGDIAIEPGDTLLMQTGPNFEQAHRNNPDFVLVSGLDDHRPVRHGKTWLSLGLLVLLVGLLTANRWPTVMSAFLVAGLMIGFRCISTSEARRSVQWDILLAIAASIGLGTALDRSGAATMVGGLIVSATQSLGPIAGLAAVFVVTTLFTELVTNNAAAVLMFPIALAIAEKFQVDPRGFALVVAYAASFSFITPIGYQTNLLVYGPGGYRFSDYLKIGTPLNLIMGLVVVLLVPVVWPL